MCLDLFSVKAPCGFDSCKRPPPVSDFSVFAFWVFAYGSFDCIFIGGDFVAGGLVWWRGDQIPQIHVAVWQSDKTLCRVFDTASFIMYSSRSRVVARFSVTGGIIANVVGGSGGFEMLFSALVMRYVPEMQTIASH